MDSQSELRICDASLDLVEHLISEFSECFAHILYVFLNDLFQKRRQFKECSIGGVLEPRLDKYAVVRLLRKIFGHVVHDDRSVQWTSNFT